MEPKIGKPRYYKGNNIEVIYPGEQASASIDFDPSALNGNVIPIGGWRVEPIPGLHGWYLRMRWRIERWWKGKSV